MDILNHREGGMVFDKVFFLSPLQCTVTELEPLIGWKSLEKYKSQGKAEELTVNSKEENSYNFCMDFVQEFGLCKVVVSA